MSAHFNRPFSPKDPRSTEPTPIGSLDPASSPSSHGSGTVFGVTTSDVSFGNSPSRSDNEPDFKASSQIAVENCLRQMGRRVPDSDANRKPRYSYGLVPGTREWKKRYGALTPGTTDHSSTLNQEESSIQFIMYEHPGADGKAPTICYSSAQPTFSPTRMKQETDLLPITPSAEHTSETTSYDQIYSGSTGPLMSFPDWCESFNLDSNSRNFDTSNLGDLGLQGFGIQTESQDPPFTMNAENENEISTSRLQVPGTPRRCHSARPGTSRSSGQILSPNSHGRVRKPRSVSPRYAARDSSTLKALIDRTDFTSTLKGEEATYDPSQSDLVQTSTSTPCYSPQEIDDFLTVMSVYEKIEPEKMMIFTEPASGEDLLG